MESSNDSLVFISFLNNWTLKQRSFARSQQTSRHVCEQGITRISTRTLMVFYMRMMRVLEKLSEFFRTISRPNLLMTNAVKWPHQIWKTIAAQLGIGILKFQNFHKFQAFVQIIETKNWPARPFPTDHRSVNLATFRLFLCSLLYHL